MTIEEQVLKKLRGLPPAAERSPAVRRVSEGGQKFEKNLRSLEGLLRDLNVDITEEDIAQARGEMIESHRLLSLTA